jgi:hypothetical protein
MKKAEIKSPKGYFNRYIDLVEENDLFEAFDAAGKVLENLDLAGLNKIGEQVYAPGKWTIKDIFQHIIDTERVFAYRAMRFARTDSTPLPGYDEDFFAQHALAGKRNLEEILHEFKVLRESTILLFKSFQPSVFANSGISFNQEISVLAIAFTIIGHQVHHLNIIKERYEPIIR